MFKYELPAVRVDMGMGALSSIPSHVADLGGTRVFAIVSPSQRSHLPRIAEMLGSQLAADWSEVRPRVPTDLVGAARARAQQARADFLVAFGGGSAIGLAKALAVEFAWPILAVPTTYSGSEMTNVFGVLDGGVKVAKRHGLAQPRVVVYDPSVTFGLPAEVTAASGMNALAQAVGSQWPGANPVARALGRDAMARLMTAIPQSVAGPADVSARSEALLGAHLAGTALTLTGLSPHHQLVHAVGDITQLPHAQLHAVLLPHTAEAATRSDGELPSDLGIQLHELLLRLALPTSLSALGFPRSELERLIRQVGERVGHIWDQPDVESILSRAHDGQTPTTDGMAHVT